MSFNGIFDFTDSTGSDNNGLSRDNSDTTDDILNAFDWGNNIGSDLYNHQYAGPSMNGEGWYLHPSDAGGPSQPYTGVEVLGGLDGFLNLDNPATAPTSLYPANWGSLDEGHNTPLYPGATMPTLSPRQATIPPLPTDVLPSHGSWYDPYAALAGSSHNPEVVPSFGDLGFDFTAAGPSTMPAVHLSPACIPSREEPWGQIPGQPGPSHFPSLSYTPPSQTRGVSSPRNTPPAPIASSSGPQRTSKRAKGSRKYDPVKSTKKNGDSDEGEQEDGWDVALVQFRAKLHDIVRSGQPAGGLSPEVALAAKIIKAVKEDLKRSPLQDTKAGEGKRTRNVEDYFTWLLREIPPVKLTPIPGQHGLREDDTKAATFARLADALEAELVVVNQHPTLRYSTGNPQVGKGTRLEQTEDRVKKNQREKAKRDGERYHLERISHLFKVAGPRQTWTRVDVLSFAIVFLLYGSDVFTPGFVQIVPIARGL